jgi:hypothetical protein
MNRILPLLRSPLTLALLLAGACLGLMGCSHTEEANNAERPWNAPQGWEGGIPPSLYERERR